MNPPESFLIATDFSREAGYAARRAASIARDAGLRGTLAHVLPGSLPVGLHLQAAAQAQQALALVADEMLAQGVTVEPRLLSGDVRSELARAAAEFDLVVAGARGEDVLLDFSLGRTSIRLVRESRRPTLIVKRAPEGPYRRAIVAVDFSEPSYLAAACGSRLAPKADLDFVHAFEVEFESSLRLAGADADTIHGHRRDAREKAMLEMDAFVRRLALPRERVSPFVAHGYPPRVLLDRAAASGAELVILGKHAAGVIEHALIGSVALQVLEMAQCDVLIVPSS